MTFSQTFACRFITSVLICTATTFFTLTQVQAQAQIPTDQEFSAAFSKFDCGIFSAAPSAPRPEVFKRLNVNFLSFSIDKNHQTALVKISYRSTYDAEKSCAYSGFYKFHPSLAQLEFLKSQVEPSASEISCEIGQVFLDEKLEFPHYEIQQAADGSLLIAMDTLKDPEFGVCKGILLRAVFATH